MPAIGGHCAKLTPANLGSCKGVPGTGQARCLSLAFASSLVCEARNLQERTEEVKYGRSPNHEMVHRYHQILISICLLCDRLGPGYWRKITKNPTHRILTGGVYILAGGKQTTGN